jgi:AAA+ ATPase superfamily predicted ATPase
MEYQQLNLHKFKSSDIKRNSIIGIIGKRNSGKSILTKNLIKKRFKDTNSILVCSKFKPLYSKLPDNIQCFLEYKDNIINDLIKKQKTSENQALIVLDDILDMIQDKSDTLKSLFFNGRHYKTSLIFTIQCLISIQPELRSNIDYIFVFYTQNNSERKKIYEQYCPVNISFDIFNNILDFCTKNHDCLVIDITSNSGIEKQFFWYKADNVDNIDINSTEKVNEVIETENEYEVIETGIKTEIENNRSYLGYIKSFIW